MATKISVNLSDEVHDAARELAVKHDVTLSEILRRAISTEVFLDREFERGKTLLLRDEQTKEIERVHFR